jgi:formamidopyrimidine-DNA glycosylase
MPELPEVETIARKLLLILQHRRFLDIVVLWPKTIANIDPSLFVQAIQGAAIRQIYRRGKYLLISLDNENTLVVHLRMSGRFDIYAAGEEHKTNKHTRVQMVMDNGLVIDYIDQRKFGRFYLVKDPDTITGKLGPEPLSQQFTIKWLSQTLTHRSSQIKTLLLNQRFIAGLGNIYANEALWKARIHPFRKANTLNESEIQQLHQAIIDVVQQAINHGGTSLDDRQYTYPDGQLGTHQRHLYVYDRAGEQCERCGYELKRIVQAQRSTYYCPICQSTPDATSPKNGDTQQNFKH